MEQNGCKLNNQTNTTNQENTTILPDILNQGTFWKATGIGPLV
ncbi:MAG: hypothetical protein R2769_12780 [Saprospiraceae bacterium]